MKALQGLKAPHFLFILYVLLLLSSASLIFFYCFSNQQAQAQAQAQVNGGRSQPPNSKDHLSNREGRELNQALRRATMADRTVILTMLNQEWATPGSGVSVFDLFLEGFRVGQGTKNFLNHLLVLAVDGQAFHYCSAIHPHCFNLATYRINYSTWKPFKYMKHLKLGWRKIEILGEVLELGYNVLCTDADVMWFRNPFPHFEEPHWEINTARADHKMPNKSYRADGGFFYLKSNAISVEFFKYWKMARILHPNVSHQLIFETIKDDATARMLRVRIKYLDTAYFGSVCHPSTDMSKLCAVHAKCHDKSDGKVHHLRLVLDAWKNFTTHQSEEILEKSKPSQGPINCCKCFASKTQHRVVKQCEGVTSDIRHRKKGQGNKCFLLI